MTDKRASARRAAGKDEAKRPSIAGRLKVRGAAGARSARKEGDASPAARSASVASDGDKLAALTAERARARAESSDIARRPDVAAFPKDETYDPSCTRCP